MPGMGAVVRISVCEPGEALEGHQFLGRSRANLVIRSATSGPRDQEHWEAIKQDDGPRSCGGPEKVTAFANQHQFTGAVWCDAYLLNTLQASRPSSHLPCSDITDKLSRHVMASGESVAAGSSIP
jgi:hypothetical protein